MFTVPQFLSRGQHRNDLLNPVNRGTMQAVRGMKNAPRPCRRKTSARAGSVSDHRTYHTLLWTTRKQHGQRGPKMKWSGAETAKNGRKYSKKVSGACSHRRGRGFDPLRVHQRSTAILIQSVSRLRCFFCLIAPYSEEHREAARRYARENNTADRLK